jgi:predicted small metal-binding protein
MKQFSCETMGNNCNVVLTAPTEERLLEMVSLHLRDVHGMTAISQDIVGKIKQLFVSRAPSDAAYVVDRIFEKYNCNSDPECTWRYIAEAEIILKGGRSAHKKDLKAA